MGATSPLAFVAVLTVGLISPVSADKGKDPGPKATEKNGEFLKSLRELDGKALPKDWAESVGLKAKVLSVSKPRSFRPKVSGFRGWYIDSGGKHKGKDKDVQVDSLILSKQPAESSWWQLVQTDKGYLVVATGGKEKGRVLTVDESAKTRPEGPHLTVTECLRLSSKVTATSFWKLTLTKKGVVVQSTAGKYKNWYWDFGGGAKSSKEGDRQVAHNVLLAEKEVAGSWYAVASRKR